MRRNSRTGAIGADILLALYIAMLLAYIQLSSLTLLRKYTFRETLQDETALLQLRRILLLSYDVQATQSELDFVYQKRDMRLSKVNDRLIIQPGTQIFLSAVDEAYFETYGDCVYVIYTRNGHRYEKILVRL